MGTFITPKDFVKSRFPDSVTVYRDYWLKTKFKRIYSVYQSGELDAWSSLRLKLGEGKSLDEAWENARYNIETH